MAGFLLFPGVKNDNSALLPPFFFMKNARNPVKNGLPGNECRAHIWQLFSKKK